MSTQDSQSELDKLALKLYQRGKNEVRLDIYVPYAREAIEAYVTTRVKEAERLARIDERKKVSDSIKRQRDYYEHDKLFDVEYQAGMGDAALIAYDPDKHEV